IIAAAGLVTIDIFSVAFGNGSVEGVLAQAALNKTIERGPRQRGSQSKTNFRTHARDEKGSFPAMQAFLLHFCNVPSCIPAGRQRCRSFPQIPPFNAGRLPRLRLAT